MIHYLTLNTSVELICFFLSLLFLIRDPDIIWRSAVLFLLITCVAEFTGIYIKRLYRSNPMHIHPNGWVYNILIFFQAGFFCLMFYRLLSKYTRSGPLVWGGLLLIIILHVCDLILNGVFKYDELAYTVMSIILVLYSLYFFFLIMRSEHLLALKRSASFWWVTGTLFFFFGTTAYNVFYDLLTSIEVQTKDGLHYLKYLNFIFIVILYSTWGYSFICRTWERKKSETLSSS